MTENDPMAAEWARAEIADMVQGLRMSGSLGGGLNEGSAAIRFANRHTITWERGISDEGVLVRRYVARSAWEVDPNPPPPTQDLYAQLAVRRDAPGELP